MSKFDFQFNSKPNPIIETSIVTLEQLKAIEVLYTYDWHPPEVVNFFRVHQSFIYNIYSKLKKYKVPQNKIITIPKILKEANFISPFEQVNGDGLFAIQKRVSYSLTFEQVEAIKYCYRYNLKPNPVAKFFNMSPASCTRYYSIFTEEGVVQDKALSIPQVLEKEGYLVDPATKEVQTIRT